MARHWRKQQLIKVGQSIFIIQHVTRIAAKSLHFGVGFRMEGACIGIGVGCTIATCPQFQLWQASEVIAVSVSI